MNDTAHWLDACIQEHPFNSSESDFETDLDQLYQAYNKSRECDSADICDGFKELEDFLCVLPLEDKNAVFNLYGRLCNAFQHNDFLVG